MRSSRAEAVATPSRSPRGEAEAPRPSLREALEEHGAAGPALDELAAYCADGFEEDAAIPPPGAFPLPDEPFVAAWDGYAREAEERGAWTVLRARLPQLGFPVEAGVSGSEPYRAAVRRGAPPPVGDGLALRHPERLRLWLHRTPAGRIPVIVAGHRDDFVAMLRALTRQNEPAPVPPSLGACMVAGYNNWDRVHALRGEWRLRNPAASDADWRLHFRTIIPRKELYQDRFILLSDGAYSGVGATTLGIAAAEWRELSLTIRLEHEATHYFTRRVLGSMRNSLHDELLADFVGIREARGRFRADWLLHFLGLERFPRFRGTGRMVNYRGDPPLGERAFSILQAIVTRAAVQLESFDATLEAATTPALRARLVLSVAGVPLPLLALDDGSDRLRSRWSALIRAPREGAVSRLPKGVPTPPLAG